MKSGLWSQSYRWNDLTPRVTKDFDFIASLDLIASTEEQQRLHEALKKHDFNVVPANARWQFEKKVGAGRRWFWIFTLPRQPGADRFAGSGAAGETASSLGQTGIHGRENPEAIGSELHPFSFTYDGVEILLPNPVTLALMKLVAMRDRRLASQDASKSAETRREQERQARKHAEDVWRVMAMMTREESDLAGSVLDAVRTTPVFTTATAIFSEYFQTEDDWGSQAVAGKWQAEDLNLIRKTLAAWFR